MKELVEYVVKQLVTKPDAVLVEETSGPEGVQLLLTVDPSDMGIVIGKNGQAIKSIRKLILVKAINDGVRVNLQLNDQEENQSSVLSGQLSDEGQPVISEPETDQQKTEELESENREPKTDN